MKKIAIVILNWNGKELMERFLPLVIEHSADQAEVYVVDNHSSDESVKFVRENFPLVKLIEFDRNHGFSSGYNLALRQIEAEYYVLVNTDIEVTPDWLNPMLTLMESMPDVAACQPKILSWHHRDEFEYAGAAGGFIDRFGYPFCRGRIFQNIEKDTGQYDDVAEIFWASGACLMVRAELFHRVGGFDDDFFAHMEEIDLCWRLKHLGYKIMYCGYSVVYHIGGASLDKSSPRKTYLNIRNNNTLLYKNLPPDQLWGVMIVRFFLDLLASLKFLIDGGIKHFIAVSRAHLGFYLAIKKNRKKRKKIAHRHVSKIYRGIIVFEHFILGYKKFSQFNSSKFT